MKRIFILVFALLFAFSAFSACENANKVNDIVSEPSYAQESSQISEIESSVAEESEEESETEEIVIPEDTVINFLACPDNLVHHSMYYDAIERAAEKNGVKADYSDLHNATYDFSQIYTYIKPLIDKADISYINQESLTGGDSKDISAYPRFNTPVAMGETVADLGFDIVNVAHNHMLDSGNTDFLEYCSNLFISRGVHALGYYPTEESAEDILIIDEQGVKIAFLTYTYSTNGIKNKDESFVIPYFEEELILAKWNGFDTFAHLYHTELKQELDQKVKRMNGLIDHNPVALADKMKSRDPVKKKESFSAEEVKLLMANPLLLAVEWQYRFSPRYMAT